MITDNVEKLTKSDDSNSAAYGKSKFEYSKRKIAGIVNSLKKTSNDYLPEKTVKSINDYISAEDRILYSELTSFVYAMTSEDRGTVATNLDQLMTYAYDDTNEVSKETISIIIRIWDHFNLACCQIDNTKSSFASATEETKSEMYKQLYDKFKGVEKEYIAILGIFAAIVLAFTGGITFSTSVLNNISNASIYRLFGIVILLGIVLFDILYALFSFIHKITNGTFNINKIILFVVNGVLVMLLIADLCCWGYGVREKRNKNVASDTGSSYSEVQNKNDVN